MKKIFFYLLITFSTYTFSQQYRITYNLNIFENEQQLNDPYIGSFYRKAMNGAKNLTFEMLISKDTSLFKKKEVLDINSGETKAALIKSEGKNPILITNNTIYKIEEQPLLDKKYIIKDTLLTNWKITNESKAINEYTCYKATAKYKITNTKGTFYHPVIAWFCPEIPLQHGPRGFGGLPGLILELQYREILFGAISIEKTEETVNVTFENEIITKEEYNNKINSFRNNRE